MIPEKFLTDRNSVKPHGNPPSVTHGQIRPSPTTVQKRTFRRACNRAITHGFSWYHGRQMTVADFPPTLVQRCKQQAHARHVAQKPGQNQFHAPQRRLRCMQWNCSGLSAAKLDEIKIWSASQALDVLVLCETRWTFDGEWTDAQWSYVHSGDPDTRGAGLLIMIPNSFCHSDAIQYQTIIPGRLLHIRLHNLQRPVDIVAIYQLMNDCSKQRILRRQHLWKTLDSTMQALPKRNTLVLLGDFNCNVTSFEANVGWGSFHWHGSLHENTRHVDVGDFMAILRTHGLVVLNSWNPRLGPTYKHGDHASSIDFMITRLSHADGQAKQISLLSEAPFLGSPDYGHVPLLGSLPYIRIPSKKPHVTGITSRQRQACRQAWKSNTEPWRMMMHDMYSSLENLTVPVDSNNQAPVSHIHDSLIPHLRTFLTHNTPRADGFSPDPFQVQLLRNKWDHLKEAKAQVQPHTRWELRHWLRFWYHHTRFVSTDRLHKQFAKGLRKHKAIELIRTANTYASQHDSFRLHHLIRTHAPKVPRRRIQIRNLQGQIAHPQEEFAIIRNYMHSTWHTDTPVQYQSLPPPGIPFSEEDLCIALGAVPATKAVAKPFLPGLVIKPLARHLAHHIFGLLRNWWNRSPPFFPSEWRDSWITFLAKPGKRPDRPAHLRAIALQEPIGKCITGLITKRALQQCYPTLAAWPQYAYLPNSSCQDAIHRVSQHCNEVRALIRSQRQTAFDKAAGVKSLAACGGLQLFLDLSKAFDCVDRSILFAHLPKCGISPNILALIQALHDNTKYHFFHANAFHPITVNKGVRQGCKLAPLLWACFMHCFLTRAADRVGIEWVKSNLTLFADDLHVGVTFRTHAALAEHLSNIGHILDIIREMGLVINTEKSSMIFAIAGTNCRKTQSAVQTQKAGKTCIQVPTEQGSDNFCLVSQATYLGVIMSYRNYEDCTVQARLSTAKTSFTRLSRWLTGRDMTLRRRLQIWHSCILPVIQYGIFTVGLTSQSLHRLQVCMYQMLRSCLRDHAYYTGHTHQQVLARHRCPEPLQLLLIAVRTLLRSVAQRPTESNPNDITYGTQWITLSAAEQLIQQELSRGQPVLVHSNPEEVPATKPVLTCPDCSFMTDNPANLRRHRTNVHDAMVFRNPNIDWTQAALHGLPQCKHCSQTFTTWRSFKIHVERQTCQVSRFAQTCPDPTPSSEDRPTRWTNNLLSPISSGPFDFEDAATLLATYIHGH